MIDDEPQVGQSYLLPIIREVLCVYLAELVIPRGNETPAIYNAVVLWKDQKRTPITLHVASYDLGGIYETT